jgi:hypothetical protein
MTSTANSVGTEPQGGGVDKALPPTEQTEKGALQTAPQSFVPSQPAEPPADNLRGPE